MQKLDIPEPWKAIYARFPQLYHLVFPEAVTEGGFKHKHAIDLMKAITMPVCMALAFHFRRNSATMMTYTALHGSYGLLWVAKSTLFRDPKWEKRVPWSQALVVMAGLGMFFVTPYRIARYNVQHSPVYLAAMITINILGNFLHFTSDMQKAVSLELRPGQLITDKLFAICRHPNYLGESLIYGSFVGLGDSWLMAGYLITYVVAYWWPNIYWKEKSMSRYESWKAYCMETALLVPFVW